VFSACLARPFVNNVQHCGENYPEVMKMNALPLGFSMALAQNKTAMKHFASLTEQEKQVVLHRAQHVRSKSDMRQLVSSLTD
jgi:hypothetical protein